MMVDALSHTGTHTYTHSNLNVTFSLLNLINMFLLTSEEISLMLKRSLKMKNSQRIINQLPSALHSIFFSIFQLSIVVLWLWQLYCFGSPSLAKKLS